MFHQTPIQQKNAGYLELIIGPMFSGKTSKIIHLEKMYTLCDLSVCVVNYAGDTRYHKTKLSTHDKQMIECVRTSDIRDIMDMVNTADVFLVNEIQFFDDVDVVNVIHQLVETHHKIVHISGLDGTFERKPFGNAISRLIPFADDVTKLSSICKICKQKASFSKRINTNKDKVLIGGDDMYMPVCRACYHS